MSPAVEESPEREFTIRFRTGTETRVRASTICRPDDSSEYFRLKLAGQIVGEFHRDEVTGWSMRELAPGRPGVKFGGGHSLGARGRRR